jgi:hypothetical protein
MTFVTGINLDEGRYCEEGREGGMPQHQPDISRTLPNRRINTNFAIGPSPDTYRP